MYKKDYHSPSYSSNIFPKHAFMSLHDICLTLHFLPKKISAVQRAVINGKRFSSDTKTKKRKKSFDFWELKKFEYLHGNFRASQR